jgi:hypothetical protein
LLQLEEGNARRMINLARLIATLIASKAIPITVLKVCVSTVIVIPSNHGCAMACCAAHMLPQSIALQ